MRIFELTFETDFYIYFREIFRIGKKYILSSSSFNIVIMLMKFVSLLFKRDGIITEYGKSYHICQLCQYEYCYTTRTQNTFNFYNSGPTCSRTGWWWLMRQYLTCSFSFGIRSVFPSYFQLLLHCNTFHGRTALLA